MNLGEMNGYSSPQMIIFWLGIERGGGEKNNLVLEEAFPGFSTKDEANNELKDVERYVEDDAIEPHNSGPPPSTAMDTSKVPVCIHCNDCRHLQCQSAATSK